MISLAILEKLSIEQSVLYRVNMSIKLDRKLVSISSKYSFENLTNDECLHWHLKDFLALYKSQNIKSQQLEIFVE